ncbi:MAG TPA: hypothetical protein VIP11_02930 [Gemmatimonadaceae bacterium]
MRRFFAFGLLALALGCSDTLGPVQTVDGEWDGIQNGYSMALALTQTGTDVVGTAQIGNVGGFGAGNVVGTFKYPTVDLTIVVEGLDPITYKGTMSSSEAVINARLNGAGIKNVEINVKKR